MMTTQSDDDYNKRDTPTEEMTETDDDVGLTESDRSPTEYDIIGWCEPKDNRRYKIDGDG